MDDRLGRRGGASGTVFKIDTNGSTLTTLHTFTNNDAPHTGLIQGTDGNLYGTTQYGYPDNQFGSVFTMDTSGTTFVTLHSFALSDGARPSDLIQAADGYLYGTTDGGGASGYGTVFRVDTAGTVFATLHMFSGNDGTSPEGGVIQAADGELYGTTLDGGASDYGTIFKIATNGTSFVTLHTFANGSDGEWPFVRLIQAADGFLYGTTSEGDGDPSYAGTVFKIDTDGSTLTTLHYFFYGGDGAFPYAGLTQATDGNLYGTTYGHFEGDGPRDDLQDRYGRHDTDYVASLFRQRRLVPLGRLDPGRGRKSLRDNPIRRPTRRGEWLRDDFQDGHRRYVHHAVRVFG